MSEQEVATAMSGLALRLAEVWNEERCDWRLLYEDPFYGIPPSWQVILTWTDEHTYTHGADYVTYDWISYGETAEEALLGAVEWAEALHAWGLVLDDEGGRDTDLQAHLAESDRIIFGAATP